MVLAAPEVPAGKYAAEILGQAGVCVKPVSEDNVKAVVTKVSLGEADAGIVYVTDVTAGKDKVEGVEIPEELNVVATYPIATVKESKSPDQAQAFMDLVLSAEGQQVLKEHGFLPPPTASRPLGAGGAGRPPPPRPPEPGPGMVRRPGRAGRGVPGHPLLGLLGRIGWGSLGAELTSPRVLEALRLSMVCSLGAVAVSMALGVPLAFLLARVEFPAATWSGP